MTDSELFPFLDVFKSLQRVFPKRIDEHEQKQLGMAYFKAMRRFSLSQAQAGADVWVQRGKYFPKPAEWMDAIPRQRAMEALVEIQELSAFAASEYLDAERRHYDGDPCGCSACRAAGVDHRFLRFVPEFDANDQDAKARIGDRVIVRGHWAHGDELKRWYAAKEKFWAQFHAMVAKHTMTKKTKARQPFAARLAEIYAPREKAAPVADREPGVEG